MVISPGQRFAVATCVAVLPQAVAIGASAQLEASSMFVALTILWNAAPIVMSAIFFVAGARSAAWGWLVATGLWGFWEAISVALSDTSTAFLAFIWGPVWAVILLGPIGAGIAILRARRQQANKETR